MLCVCVRLSVGLSVCLYMCAAKHSLTQSKLSGHDYPWCRMPVPRRAPPVLNRLGECPCNTDSTLCVVQGDVLKWQRHDTSAPDDDDAAQQPQPGPAPTERADVDHSNSALNGDHAASVAGQAVSHGAHADTPAAPSNGTALPRAPTPILAARAVPAQVAATAYARSASEPQRSKVAAAPAATSAATVTAAPDTSAGRPASAGASTAERPEPDAALRGKGKKARSHANKNRPGAGQAGAAPSSLQPASSEATSLAMSANIPAKASAKPPRPTSARKRAAVESPSLPHPVAPVRGALQHIDTVTSPRHDRHAKQQKKGKTLSAAGELDVNPSMSQSTESAQHTYAQPSEQTGNLMAAESLADKGKQQQTKAAAQGHACASDAIDPAGGDAVSAAAKLMQDCAAEIAYMLAHPDSDLD
jgi:hypothetical protein